MFWRKADLLDPDRAAWVQDRMAWIVNRIGPREFTENLPLILPTRDFFAAGSGTDHATAQAVLNDIARLMRMRDWPVTLLEMPDLGEDIWHGYQTLTQTAGTFELTEDGAIIRYMPSQLKTPIPFISTMAHEMAHFWLAPHRGDWPGGDAQHELVTDLTSITHGFGIFQMMTADAWGWAGYLSQETRAYALALFLRATGQDPAEARAHLAGRPNKLLERALRQLDRDPAPIATLRSAGG